MLLYADYLKKKKGGKKKGGGGAKKERKGIERKEKNHCHRSIKPL